MVWWRNEIENKIVNILAPANGGLRKLQIKFCGQFYKWKKEQLQETIIKQDLDDINNPEFVLYMKRKTD